MPISSFYRQKENTTQKPWNTTRAGRRRKYSTSSPVPSTSLGNAWTDGETGLGKYRAESSQCGSNNDTMEVNSPGRKYQKRFCAVPVSATGISEGTSCVRSLESHHRVKTAPSQRKLRRRETDPEFMEVRCDSATSLKRCNSDSIIVRSQSVKRRLHFEVSSRMKSEVYSRTIRDKSLTKRNRRKTKVDIDTQAENHNRFFTNQDERAPRIGEKVICVLNKRTRSGVLRFLGTTHFSQGEWSGIDLDEPCGKNDGSVKGIRYFSCGENYGIFVHSHKVRGLDELSLNCTFTVTDGLQKEEVDGKPVIKSNFENSCNIKMEGVGIQNIGVIGGNLRKWPGHCSKGPFTKTRPRSFSSGMKYGLNLETSKDGIQDCLELDLAELSRSVSLPKISSKHLFLISGDDVKTAAKSTQEQNGGTTITNGSNKQGSCPNLSNGFGEEIRLPILNQKTFASDMTEENTCTTLCSMEGVTEKSKSRTEECLQRDYHESGIGDSSNEGVVMTTPNNELCNLTTQKQVKRSIKLKRANSFEGFRSTKLGSTAELSKKDAHASLEKQTTIDAFVQGKYCSCPSLVPSQHMSGAIEACIDLGRTFQHVQASKTAIIEENGIYSPFNEPESNSNKTEDVVSRNSEVKLKHLGCSISLSKLITCTCTSFGVNSKTSLETETGKADSWPCLAIKTQQRIDTCKTTEKSQPTMSLDRSVNSIIGNIDDDVFADATETSSCNESVKSLGKEERNSQKCTTNSTKSKHLVARKKPMAGQVQSESQSLSGSQGSLSSVGTNESQGYSRKGTRASAKVNTQVKKSSTKIQRDSNSKMVQRSQEKKGLGKTDLKASPFNPRLVKRHTLTTLRKFQPNLPATPRPSVNRKPLSTLSEPDSIRQRTLDPSRVLPVNPKSRLPMIRRISHPVTLPKVGTSSRPGNPQTKGSSTGDVKTGVQNERGMGVSSVKRVSSFTSATEKQKKELSSASSGSLGKDSTKRKASSLQRSSSARVTDPSKGQGVTSSISSKPPVTLRLHKAGTTATGADKKSLTSTKTTLVSKSNTPAKPNTPPSAKITPSKASIPKHHPSRLPRKIISRDTSTESAYSHDNNRDADTHSIGTEGSDYESRRSSRRDSYPEYNHYDADRSDLESSTRSWHYFSSRAPDILTGTREVHKKSVEVQVDIDEDEAVQEIHDKVAKLDRLLEVKTERCEDLENSVTKKDSSLFASAMLLTIFSKKLQNSSRYVGQLKWELQSSEYDLRQNQERLADEEANNVKLQEEMMYVTSEHAVAIETLKADHEGFIEALRYTMRKQQMEELTLAAETHVAELQKTNKKHDNKVAEIIEGNNKDIAELHENYKDEIVELESRHSRHVDEILEEHQIEVETIKTDYEEQRTAHETKLYGVTSECTYLNIKLKRLHEETEKDIESRIQVAIEKYKSLPAELDSMKAVLEMKNDEIKQLRKETMETNMELDHLRKMVTRMKKLEHENESLSFVVETKSKFERQLSVEQERLKSNLERESAKLKRMSLENEELQWRLFNSPSPSEGIGVDGQTDSPPIARRHSYRLSASLSDADTINE